MTSKKQNKTNKQKTTTTTTKYKVKIYTHFFRNELLILNFSLISDQYVPNGWSIIFFLSGRFQRPLKWRLGYVPPPPCPPLATSLAMPVDSRQGLAQGPHAVDTSYAAFAILYSVKFSVCGTPPPSENPGLAHGCPCHKIYGVEAVGLSISNCDICADVKRVFFLSMTV